MNNQSHIERSTACPLAPPVRGKKEFVSGVSKLYHTTRLGAKLFQPKSGFDLGDPCRHKLNPEYSSLHDPCLKDYLHRKDIRQNLLARGFITKDEKVICSLLESNTYKEHLTDVELDWCQFRAEQKVLVQRFFTLKQQGMINPTVRMADLTDCLLQRGRNTFIRKCNHFRSSPASEVKSDSLPQKLPSINQSGKIFCHRSSSKKSEMERKCKHCQMLQEIIKEVRTEMRQNKVVIDQKEQKGIKQDLVMNTLDSKMRVPTPPSKAHPSSSQKGSPLRRLRLAKSVAFDASRKTSHPVNE